MAGARQLVDTPTFTPLPYGLLSVVEYPATEDVHWMQGITYRSHCVTGAGSTTYDECLVVTGVGGPPPGPPTKVDNVQDQWRGATPFTVYVEFDCAPVGSMDEAKKVATDALAQAEPFQVEQAFWTGLAGGVMVAFPHLAQATPVVDAQSIVINTAAVTVTGTAVSMARGIGLLEDALADCFGGEGVLHVPKQALPSVTALQYVETRGPRLRTLGGNWVAVGAGYPGTSPAGAAPAVGTTWLYGTGPVMAYRGPPRIFEPRESLDRAKNTLKMIAERTFVLGWECCHFAVLVNLA